MLPTLPKGSCGGLLFLWGLSVGVAVSSVTSASSSSTLSSFSTSSLSPSDVPISLLSSTSSLLCSASSLSISISSLLSSPAKVSISSLLSLPSDVSSSSASEDTDSIPMSSSLSSMPSVLIELSSEDSMLDSLLVDDTVTSSYTSISSPCEISSSTSVSSVDRLCPGMLLSFGIPFSSRKSAFCSSASSCTLSITSSVMANSVHWKPCILFPVSKDIKWYPPLELDGLNAMALVARGFLSFFVPMYAKQYAPKVIDRYSTLCGPLPSTTAPGLRSLEMLPSLTHWFIQ